MKGVFEISAASRYNDLIAERYHFPRNYLRATEACVGDWIVYRETGSGGGRKAYVAAGLVQSIDPDLSITPSSTPAYATSSNSTGPYPIAIAMVGSSSACCESWIIQPSLAAH